ncbi:MAG: ATP-binding protein [bacterium]
MKYLDRKLEKQIKKLFFDGKAIIVLGARQVGKTTLINKVLEKFSVKKIARINGDDPDDIEKIYKKGLEYYIYLFSDVDIIYIDEAQKIPEIGNTIKLLVDHYKKQKQIVVTGSSSINLLDNTSESLTGRKYSFYLFGLSIAELAAANNKKYVESIIDQILLYGLYPEIVTSQSFQKKELLLDQITDSNLYQDILGYQNIKNPLVIRQLLKMLALQIGQEVSVTELASSLGIDKNTVGKFIDLLERAFIVFRLSSFTKKKRKEISKNKKIYFYDLGIRNALLNDFRDFENRSDYGNLWENFIILEMLKRNKYLNVKNELFFWRTFKGAEIDLVETTIDQTIGYEIKSNKKSPEKPSSWKYGSYQVINKQNYLQYLIK